MVVLLHPQRFRVHLASEPASCGEPVEERSFEAAAVAFLEHVHLEAGEAHVVVHDAAGRQLAFVLALD